MLNYLPNPRKYYESHVLFGISFKFYTGFIEEANEDYSLKNQIVEITQKRKREKNRIIKRWWDKVTNLLPQFTTKKKLHSKFNKNMEFLDHEEQNVLRFGK